MKRPHLLTALLIGIFALIPFGTANAADVKIGMIDSQKIMRESKAAKKARDILMKELETKRSQYIAKESEARKLEEEIKKEGANMTPAARQEKTEKLEKEIKELGRLKADMEEELKKKSPGPFNWKLPVTILALRFSGRIPIFGWIDMGKASPFALKVLTSG